MATCTINAGVTRDCSRGIGGVSEIYIANITDISDITLDTGNVVNAITTGSAGFYTYQPLKESGQFIETDNLSLPNGSQYIHQEITFGIGKTDAATREELQLLSTAQVIAIVKLNNGEYQLVGLDNDTEIAPGADVKVDSNSGKAYGDARGFTVTIMADAKRFAYSVSGSIVDAALE
jgi:hypothetical protein